MNDSLQKFSFQESHKTGKNRLGKSCDLKKAPLVFPGMTRKFDFDLGGFGERQIEGFGVNCPMKR